jgi:hypothetical protein
VPPERGRAAICQGFVAVVVGLVEPVTPDVAPAVPPAVPEAPIELVPPDDVSVLAVPGVVPAVLPAVLPAAGAPVLLLEVDVSVFGAGAGVVVDELEDDVVGAGVVSSRLVQAPSETAAMSASAAHEVRDAFIGKLLEGVVRKVAAGTVATALSAL